MTEGISFTLPSKDQVFSTVQKIASETYKYSKIIAKELWELIETIAVFVYKTLNYFINESWQWLKPQLIDLGRALQNKTIQALTHGRRFIGEEWQKLMQYAANHPEEMRGIVKGSVGTIVIIVFCYLIINYFRSSRTPEGAMD